MTRVLVVGIRYVELFGSTNFRDVDADVERYAIRRSA